MKKVELILRRAAKFTRSEILRTMRRYVLITTQNLDQGGAEGSVPGGGTSIQKTLVLVDTKILFCRCGLKVFFLLVLTKT